MSYSKVFWLSGAFTCLNRKVYTLFWWLEDFYYNWRITNQKCTMLFRISYTNISVKSSKQLYKASVYLINICWSLFFHEKPVSMHCSHVCTTIINGWRLPMNNRQYISINICFHIPLMRDSFNLLENICLSYLNNNKSLTFSKLFISYIFMILKLYSLSNLIFICLFIPRRFRNNF